MVMTMAKEKKDVEHFSVENIRLLGQVRSLMDVRKGLVQLMTGLRLARDQDPDVWGIVVTGEIMNAWDACKAALKSFRDRKDHIILASEAHTDLFVLCPMCAIIHYPEGDPSVPYGQYECSCGAKFIVLNPKEDPDGDD